jgi:mono/diheme cytochrome c family protein
MARGLKVLLGSIVIAAIASALAQSPRQPPPSVQTLVAEGKKVFEGSCSTQYCHGPGGAGGQGPRLIDYPMSAEHVSATIREGRSGTPMAPFKGILEPAQIDAVIAYVLSISSGGKLPVSVTPAAAPMAPTTSAPSTVPVAIGKEKGTPAAGAEVFFDATKLSSCRTCHTYNKRGGPLGLDFADARKTPEEILASISKPRVAARAYPVITVTTSSGVILTGIRGGEAEDALQVFDVAVPPVRRSFPKSQIVGIQPSTQGVFDHTKLVYSRQQLLDVAALLGSAENSAGATN